MSGVPFWTDKEPEMQIEDHEGSEEDVEVTEKPKEVPYSQQQDVKEFRNRLAEKVVQDMQDEKKSKI